MTPPVSVCRQQNASVDLYVIIRTDIFVRKFHENKLIQAWYSIISFTLYNYINIFIQVNTFVLSLLK